MDCDQCCRWTHIKCSGFVTEEMYQELISSESQSLFFICSECSIHTLPFSAEDSINLSPSDDNPDENITTPSEADPEHFTCFRRKGLHFIHLNVRSLISKISELRYIAVKTNAAVICLSETWLDDSVSDGEISIDRYCLIRRDRNRTVVAFACIYGVTYPSHREMI